MAGTGALVLDNPHAVASYAMQTGNVGGRAMGWGVLQAGSGTNWNSGVRADVWMDVTNDNKVSWIRCGPFSVTTAGKRITTPAYPTSDSASRAFRVYASVNGPAGSTGVTCTG